MKVYEAISDALLAEGAETVFCVMGDGNLDLLSHLAQRGVRLVHARHEQNAVAMADGYASAGGFPALCSVTHGPGLTQTATSLAVASARGTPLLLLTGDTPITNRHHVQGFEQEGFIAATGARLQQLRAPTTTVEDLTFALHAARRGAEPVVFNMPTNVQLAELPAAQEHSYRVSSPAPLSTPDPADIERAAELLKTAAHPAVLAGRGAVRAAAGSRIAELATLLEAPIVTTLLASGLLADHPLSAGVSGGLGRDVAGDLLRDADCVLAIGTSLSGFTTAEGAALDGSTLIVVDSNAASHDAGNRTDVFLHGDARLATDALLASLGHRLPGRPTDSALRDRIRSDAAPADTFDDQPGAIDPRRAMIALDQCLPRDRFVVTDGGHFGSFLCSYMRTFEPSSFLFAPAFGAIGQGLATAIGASFAQPHRRITLVVGDGGFMMNMQELETAVRYNLPLSIIVVNDHGYGQEFHSLATKMLPTTEAIIPTPNLDRVAESVGARGYRVTNPADLASLADWLNGAKGTVLIDVRVSRDVLSPATQEIFFAVRRGIDE